MYSDEIATQQQAIAKCDSVGGQLAIFPNRYHNDFASAFLYAEGDSPWIGVQSDTEQGLRYSWYDKRRLTYTNWQPGYPEQGTGKKCVKMWYFSSTKGGFDAGTWENRQCNEKRPFICSKNATPGMPQGKSFYNPYNCPEDWIPHESSCFKLMTSPAGFDDAQAKCQSFGQGDWVGNIMTVWNVYQQRLLNSFFNSDEVASNPPTTMWLGLKVSCKVSTNFRSFRRNNRHQTEELIFNGLTACMIPLPILLLVNRRSSPRPLVILSLLKAS